MGNNIKHPPGSFLEQQDLRMKLSQLTLDVKNLSDRITEFQGLHDSDTEVVNRILNGNRENPDAVTLEQARSENNQLSGNVDANGNQLDNLVNANEDQQAATLNQLNEGINTAKAYADSVASSPYHIAGNYDASGGAWPTAGTGASNTVRSGDTYDISVAGTIAGNALEVGDSIIAKVDNPGQTAGNWKVSLHNAQAATESTRGTLYVATGAEAADENSTLDTDSVTPKKLWQNFWQRVIALPWTWAAKQIFTLAPRFASVTVGQFLKVDTNKDLTSVDKIQPSEINTDDTAKFITQTQIDTFSQKQDALNADPFDAGNINAGELSDERLSSSVVLKYAENFFVNNRNHFLQVHGHNVGHATLSVTAGTGAGTGAVATISGTMLTGQVVITTGSSPVLSGDIFTITFPDSFAGNWPHPIFFANNEIAGQSARLVYATVAAANKIALKNGTGALNANTQYKWFYAVFGGPSIS